MSYAPKSALPTRSGFWRHGRHRSSTDSYYSCDTVPHYQLARTQSPPFHPPAPLLPSHILSCEQSNNSQSSPDHLSVLGPRYPEPYSTDPFLPLHQLRRLRSNEHLPIFPALEPLVAHATLPRRAARKPAPIPSDDSHPGPYKSPAATAQGQICTEQYSQPNECPQLVELTNGSAFSQTHSNDSVTSLYTCYTSPPTNLHPASSPLRHSFDPLTPEQGPRSSMDRTASIIPRRESDVGSALELMFGVQMNTVDSRRVAVCTIPGEHDSDSFAWSEEQSVLMDACGGMEPDSGIANTDGLLAASQTRPDPDKTPTKESGQILWGNPPTARFQTRGRRPSPIYVGKQAQPIAGGQITVSQQQTEKSAVLKNMGEVESPTSIKSGEVSPRKLSDASSFSLCMFPPTPTTLNRRDTIWTDLNGAAVLGFSPTRQSFAAPVAAAFASSLRSPGSRPPPSPTTPRSAPLTSARRTTIQVDHILDTRRRASADVPRSSTFNARGRSTSVVENRSRTLSPARRSLYLTQPRPENSSYGPTAEQRVQKPRKRSDTISSNSDSVYSDHTESESCYSDSAASMTSSVAAAVLQAQQERRFSRQARLAYMRDSLEFDRAREFSPESQPSSSSSSTFPARSIGPVTPEDDYLDNKSPLPFSGFEYRGAVPNISVIRPSRKPVPRADTLSIADRTPEPRTPESRQSALSPTLLSYGVRSERSVRKRGAPAKIVISHPHLNVDNVLGLQVPPSAGSFATRTAREGVRSLAHSKSTPTLRADRPNVLQKKKKEPTPPFDRHGMPSEEQLKIASEMNIYDQYGKPVRFGDVFEGQKTAVCFIRHFWCPLCQDYMSSIVHLTEPSLVEKAGVKLVIIGNGSPAMIKSYRDDIFRCPYEMYTDPSRSLYNVLGMTLRTTEGGEEEEKGSYVKHGTFMGTMMVLKNALKMPLANAGDIKQLGGEFILGPGLTCSFTSRMHTTRSHTPIRDLLEAAGVDTNPWATELSLLQSEEEQSRWMDVQNEDLDRLIRRGLQASCGQQYCSLDDGVTGAGELDLGEFRRLLEQLKNEIPEPEPWPKTMPSMNFTGTSYEIEVKGQKRVELDHLGAVLQSRNGSGTWEACRSRGQSSRPTTAS